MLREYIVGKRVGFVYFFCLRKGEAGVVGEEEDGETGQFQPFHCRNPTQVPHSLLSAMQPESATVIPSIHGACSRITYNSTVS